MATTDLMEFPARLRAERKRVGLTQQQAAERLGWSQPSYSALERGEIPSVFRFATICEKLGLDPARIVPGLAPPSQKPGVQKAGKLRVRKDSSR